MSNNNGRYIALATRIWEEPGRWIFLSYVTTTGFQLDWYDAGAKVSSKPVIPKAIDAACRGATSIGVSLSPAALDGLIKAWPEFRLKALGEALQI